MKKSMIFIGTILVLLLLVVLTIPYWLDFNRYREQYIPMVERVLNRKVEIPHIRMMWFPHLGIQLENAKIFDDPDIARNPFVNVSSIEIAIKWKPLLNRRVEIQSLTLRHPAVTVIRTKDGNLNASTLGGQQEHNEGAPKTDGSGQSILAMFGVEQLTISDGTLRYEDRIEKQIETYQLEQVEIKTESVRLGDIARISAQGTLSPYQLPLSLEGSLGPLQQNLDIPQIEAQLKIGKSIVLAKGHARDRKLNLDISSSNISLDDVPINLQLNKPVMVTEVFAHVQALLAETKTSTSSPNKITVSPFQFNVEMGGTRLNISGQAVGSQLEMNGVAPVIHSTDLPLSLPLQTPVSLTNLKVKTKIDGSLVQVMALTGEVFDGYFEANGQWNGEGAVSKFESTGTIQKVNVEKVQNMLKPAAVTVTGEGAMYWNIEGILPLNAFPLLDGRTQLTIVSGQLKGFDLLQRIEQVLKLRRVLSPDRGVTKFSKFSGEVEFQKDRYPIKTVLLEGQKRDFLMQGSGVVTQDQSIRVNGDLRLGNKVSDNIVQQIPVAKVALQQRELVVPFAVEGTLSEPKVGLDFRAIQKRLQKQVGETIQKVLKGDPKEVQEILRKGKGLLKGLLGR